MDHCSLRIHTLKKINKQMQFSFSQHSSSFSHCFITHFPYGTLRNALLLKPKNLLYYWIIIECYVIAKLTYVPWILNYFLWKYTIFLNVYCIQLFIYVGMMPSTSPVEKNRCTINLSDLEFLLVRDIFRSSVIV